MFTIEKCDATTIHTNMTKYFNFMLTDCDYVYVDSWKINANEMKMECIVVVARRTY